MKVGKADASRGLKGAFLEKREVVSPFGYREP